MTILTSDDGDGSLSPVAWSHGGCNGTARPSSRPGSSTIPSLSCVNLDPCEVVWKERYQPPPPSWIEGQWVKRVTPSELHLQM